MATKNCSLKDARGLFFFTPFPHHASPNWKVRRCSGRLPHRSFCASRKSRSGMCCSFKPLKREFFATCVGVACVAVGLIGCTPGEVRKQNGRACSEFEKTFNLSERIETLNLLSEAFTRHCDEIVVTYGAQAQTQFRHKSFSVTREAANVFVPDGTFIEYVLESYERGYLSILLATSYLRRHQLDDAKVELRNLDHELFAPIYNYGEDPANLLLSAVLWEQLGDIGEARVDWLRLRDLPRVTKKEDQALRRFAGQRVSRIDDGEAVGAAWHVYKVGQFPQLDWDLRFTDSTSGYFSITPKQPFMSSCASETGVRLSTESWFNKVAIRHSHAYHPLLNVQTWIRLPVGIVYSLIPVAAGAGIMVGGCMLDAAGDGKGALCQLSVIGGVALLRTTPVVLEGTLRPDLRHWEDVPAAFVVTRASEPNLEPCLAEQGADVQRIL